MTMRGHPGCRWGTRRKKPDARAGTPVPNPDTNCPHEKPKRGKGGKVELSPPPTKKIENLILAMENTVRDRSQ